MFGVIVPLSPPGETALGQLAKRGAEIGAEYINEKGGVLGRKVELSIHDSAGKNEQGVAAYRRLVSSEKAVAVFGFIHSGVNIAVNEVAIPIAINNAGISPPEDDLIENTGVDAWDRVQDINLKSVFFCCKAALRHMVPQQKGSIVNTASFVAVNGSATSQISYTASKGGVLAMSRELGSSTPARAFASTRYAPDR